jgi:hypothetical protein
VRTFIIGFAFLAGVGCVQASECPPTWQAYYGCPTPAEPASVTAAFIIDQNLRTGDSDVPGDRQGGEVVLRYPAKGLPVLPDGTYALTLRSVLDSSQARKSPAGRWEQRDQVPSWAGLGYESDLFSTHFLVGTNNADDGIRIWRGVKKAEHRFEGVKGLRTSPVTSGEELLVGWQGRLDHAASFHVGNDFAFAVAGTAFAQATTVKTEVGGAFHVGLGRWAKPPRFTVSDLPTAAMTGLGVWAGVEASRVVYEKVSDAFGTQPNRLSVVTGIGIGPDTGWASLSLTARHVLTEQVRGSRESAVGEYRVQITMPFI